MRVHFARPLIGPQEIAAVSEVLRKSKMLTNAGQVAAFEEAFATLIGGGKALAVSSCTAALHMAVMLLDLKPDEEVIVPAQTFVASAHVVEACKGIPVFVDVWPDTGQMDPEEVERAITPRTRAIMAVHFAGRPCYMGSLREIARRHKLKLIEDCATALGARHSGKHVGLLGDIGCFSFHPVKHLTTGEGGMLVTTNPDLYERAKLLREFGKRLWRYDTALAAPAFIPYDVVGFGLNFRMTEMQAALGLSQLPKLDERMQRRRRNYATLTAQLPDHDFLDLGGSESAAYCAIVMLPDGLQQEDVKSRLSERGIETSIYYPGPLPLLEYYRNKYNHHDGDFPHAERIAKNALALPVGPHLERDHMLSLAKNFKEVVGENRISGRGWLHRPSPGTASKVAS